MCTMCKSPKKRRIIREKGESVSVSVSIRGETKIVAIGLQLIHLRRDGSKNIFNSTHASAPAQTDTDTDTDTEKTL